jgi:hypothetical protein
VGVLRGRRGWFAEIPVRLRRGSLGKGAGTGEIYNSCFEKTGSLNRDFFVSSGKKAADLRGAAGLKLPAVFSKLNLVQVVSGEFWEGARRQVKYTNQVFKIVVLLSAAKRTAYCCDYIATPRKSSIS